MNKFLSKIPRKEMRNFLIDEVHKELKEAYSKYGVRTSIVRHYEDILNQSPLTAGMEMPDNIYVFLSTTTLEEGYDSWDEQNIFVFKVWPSSYEYLYINFDINDAEERQAARQAAITIITNPKSFVQHAPSEISESTVQFIASKLNDADRAEYKKYIDNKHYKNFIRENEQIDFIFEQAKQIAESEQDG